MKKLVMAVMAFLFVVGTQSAFAKCDANLAPKCQADPQCFWYRKACWTKCETVKSESDCGRGEAMVCKWVGGACKKKE